MIAVFWPSFLVVIHLVFEFFNFLQFSVDLFSGAGDHLLNVWSAIVQAFEGSFQQIMYGTIILQANIKVILMISERHIIIDLLQSSTLYLQLLHLSSLKEN